ncbi:uncharacterized protein EI97DRAFT_208676 [Westerdykella ornata]|uniref:Vacuolar protein sorting-associated protein 51 homolog n=1 Tax=Westerdykella ornata TaxID=318751 RepID=A0A6A6JB33_WESOR|nr:uncharacterized protein EI97DRAFT_208676 [Westerdykella ornata]KAF2272409.1 hypothetical protein EI97DRAFT_208676 [Westerdykella ornata]
MSTIASPRPSSSIRSPSSTRTSIDTAARPPANSRRNRAALRDYYGIKSASKGADTKISEESSRTELGPDVEAETLSELDSETFDAEAYVNTILATRGLSEVLKTEADLLSRTYTILCNLFWRIIINCRPEIRNLDSDRKSLVYDNYSKLLAATSTIRRMRTNMDPLAPTTHTLSPAISHIAETAASISSSAHASVAHPAGLGIQVRIDEPGHQSGSDKDRQKERATVLWVLDTPRRLNALLAERRTKEAQEDWAEVSRLLQKWGKVNGVGELRTACENIMDAIQDPPEAGS